MLQRRKNEAQSVERGEAKEFNLNMNRISRRIKKAKAITAFSQMRERYDRSI